MIEIIYFPLKRRYDNANHEAPPTRTRPDRKPPGHGRRGDVQPNIPQPGRFRLAHGHGRFPACPGRRAPSMAAPRKGLSFPGFGFREDTPWNLFRRPAPGLGLGRDFFPNPRQEISWYEFSLTPEGKESFLFQSLFAAFLEFHWHSGYFTLSPECRRLALNKTIENQAFIEFGQILEGLQFQRVQEGEDLRLCPSLWSPMGKRALRGQR